MRNMLASRGVSRGPSMPSRSMICAAGSVAGALLLGACGSPVATVGTVAKIALEASGLTKPELPESQKPPRKVSMSIAAGKNLNADARGQPLAAVLRIYKLREASSFHQAAYDTFLTAGRDKAVLGDDLIESREMTLIPNREFNWTETVPRTANAIGVVVLFHSPASGRWRFAFDAVESEKSGVVMGAHACALTVTRGQPLAVNTQASSGSASPPLNELVHVNCKS